jgi:lipopolysaccharide export system protein LptA
LYSLALALSVVPSPDTPLTIEAARIEYFETEDRIEASGDVTVTYGEDRLRADRAVADLRREEVLAEGNVTLSRATEEVRSARVRYNWETREGRAEEVKSHFRGVNVQARALTTTPNNTVAEGSRITTCDRERPHYFVSARRIVIVPNERVSAYDASVYLLGSRILHVPRLSRSLRPSQAGSIGLPTVSFNSRDTLFLRRRTTLVDQPTLVLDLDLGLSLRRGFIGGVEAVRPGSPAWIGRLGIRQEAPNQRSRFLEVDRLPEVGLAFSSSRGSRRPPRVPTTTQEIRITRDTDGEPRWEWVAESTVGYFAEHPDTVEPGEDPDPDGGRLDGRFMVSRRQARIGPVHLSSVRLLARTSLYTNGERFTLIGLGVGDSWKIGQLRLALHRFLQATDGSSPFQFDSPDILREWRPAALLTMGRTEIGWIGRYDSDRKEFFDQEFAIARTFHCLKPRITYRSRRSQIGFELQIVGLDEVRAAFREGL